MPDFDILFDSDGWVALYVERDAHHDRATRIYRQLAAEERRMAVSNFIVAETATAISALSDQQHARDFLTFVSGGDIPILHVDENVEKRALALFSAQNRKRTSIFDCMNVAMMEALGIPTIFSFDHFYKQFDIRMVKD